MNKAQALQTKSSPQTTLAGVAAIMLATLVSGVWFQLRGPNPAALERDWSAGVLPDVVAAGFPVRSTRGMREKLPGVEAGTVYFLDARSMAEYDAGHLPFALPLPVDAFEEHYPGLAPILTADTPIVTYCSNPACDQGLLLAERLREAGHTNVSVYVEGTEAWFREEES